MTKPAPRAQLVAIGCSAGGIEALSLLVGALPSPFPAPIVIAQHVDPRRPSHLGELLGRRSALPVRTIAERTTLEPGVIYVVPSGRDVQVVDGIAELTATSDSRPSPSIDVLLRSAAEAYGENLIAVILTGSGSDGSDGARDVKTQGGTVIIENPATASFPDMPASLAPESVDIVADLDRVGPILHNLLTGAGTEPKPDDEKRLTLLLDRVRARTGVDFARYKQSTLLRRLRRRIAATEATNLDGYLRYLDDHPEEYQRLINSFLIKVTEFMRDPDLFAALRDKLLPELIGRARQESKSLRIWSAGCATGEEAYSIAMLLDEILGEELDNFNIRIFSTDIDAEAIAFARRGIYTPDAVSDLPDGYVDRYFVAVDGNYQIKKRIRSLTVFGEHDLGQRAPFPHVDLVMCRNVLIYFTSELQRRTLQLFAFSLREGGYLVLGKAETTSPLSEFFVPWEIHHKIYLRRGERVVIPPTRVGPQTTSTRRSTRERSAAPRQTKEHAIARAPLDAALMNLPFGLALIDSRYDILEINLMARRLLGIHGPALGQDFVHLAQCVPHRELLAAIDAAFRGETPAQLTISIESVPSNGARHVEIACIPPSMAEEIPRLASAIMILVRDVTDTVTQQRALADALAREADARSALALASAQAEVMQAQSNAEREELRRDNEELRATIARMSAVRHENEVAIGQLTEANRRLLQANEETTAAFEQLRSVNEELMLSSEEAQAANEEIETLNEEFQATNEELETVNEELQSTIEELNTTNADLEARSRELADLAVPIEAERARLAAIVRSMADGLLVVDASGKPVLTNEAYLQMLGNNRPVLADEKGRPLAFEETPGQRAARGEKFRMEFTVPGMDTGVRHFEATGQPIGTATTSPASKEAVIVVRDITDRSLRRLQDRFMAMASHELRTPLVPLHGYLDMLIKLLPAQGDERLRRFAHLARSQVERLTRLVGDLTTATRIQTGKFQLKLDHVELRKLLEHAVEVVRSTSPLPPIALDLPDEALVVNGDTARLEQVWMNLLGNALRHAKGTPQIDVRARRSEDSAEVEIEDYGPGIPERDIPNLFSSFFQLHQGDRAAQEGMGLGLFICMEIIKAHGGQIFVRTQEGRGTTFIVRLPLVNAGGSGKETNGGAHAAEAERVAER